MAGKYYCPKCHRKFIDWGAEKVGFRCPSKGCDGEPLKLIDPKTLENMEKPKVKKPKRKKERVVPVSSEYDLEDGVSEVPLEEEEYEEVEDQLEEELDDDYLEDEEEEIAEETELVLTEPDEEDPVEVIIEPEEDTVIEDLEDDEVSGEDTEEEE
ncbi:MAG TPA: hypothetical protein PK349_08340 [Candidatus Hydrogenedentes bacterium]|nr:hypothetical protein [Candidatus Hydrogenedentota bacterium]